jgi:hypothetical protein
MAIKLNEDELIIYEKVDTRLAKFLNEFLDNNLDEMVRQAMVDHMFTNENNIPLGSVGIDSMAHRIVFNLKSKFKV